MAVQVCKTWCFHAFPKPFQIHQDIHTNIIPAHPCQCRFSNFRVQNLVFSCLPKAISNRRYSHILFLPTPASADSPISCAKLLCFHAFPKPFQIEDIHIYYSCPPLPVQILQFRVQNLVFSCLPKAISNRRYSHILFLPTPASADSPISCAKLGVFMPSIKPFQIEDMHITLFLPTPAILIHTISCAKLGVCMPFQSHFK